MRPLSLLTRGVEACAPTLPVETPCLAYCNAALAFEGEHGRRAAYADCAGRGLEASLEYVRTFAASNANAADQNCRGFAGKRPEFFWQPVIKTFVILWDLDAEKAIEWSSQIADINIEEVFAARPPSFASAAWLSGEWLRFREGLSPYALDQLDTWIEFFFRDAIQLDEGRYDEPGDTGYCDQLVRLCFADLLAANYSGRMKDPLGKLLERGLSRSLDADGSRAERGIRPTILTATRCVYFMHGVNYFRKRNPDLSTRAAEAVRRAYDTLTAAPLEGAGVGVALALLAGAIRHGLEDEVIP